MSVVAGLVGDNKPCFGYVIQESSKFGQLNINLCKTLGIPINYWAALKVTVNPS
jgi:hypothetical protein